MVKICRPWVTRNGRRVYAKDLGLKAICWYVTEEKHKEYLAKKAKEEADKKREESADE